MKRIIRWITKKMLKTVGIIVINSNGYKGIAVNGDLCAVGNTERIDDKTCEKEAKKVFTQRFDGTKKS